jgi:hypothetical protein
MLTGPEQKKLYAMLVKVYPDFGSLDRLLSFMTPSLNLTEFSSPAKSIKDVCLDVIKEVGRRELFKALLETVRDDDDASDAFKEFCKQYLALLPDRAAPAAGIVTNPWDTCFVFGNQPFLDRKEVRDALQRDGGFGAVAVNGPPGVGKSHCYELALFAANVSGSAGVVPVDLKKTGTYNMTAEDLMRDLARQMAFTLELFPTTKDPLPGRWAQELTSWFIGRLRASGKPWLIVLDGFGHPLLPAETRELILRMVEALRTVPDSKLLLIEFEVPDSARKYVDETPKLSELCDEDLKSFLQIAGRHRSIEISEQSVTEFAVAVESKLTIPKGSPGRTAEIARAVIDTLREKHPELVP